jgi:hypothetical protein
VPEKAPPFAAAASDFGAHEWSYGNLPPQLD